MERQRAGRDEVFAVAASSASTGVVKLPVWFITAFIGVVISMVGSIVGFGSWMTDVAVVTADIPKHEARITNVETEIDKHKANRNSHPDVGVIVNKLENLDRRLEERAKTVDKKLDSIEERGQRQWEAISEMRRKVQ